MKRVLVTGAGGFVGRASSICGGGSLRSAPSVRHPAHCRRKRGAALYFEGAPERHRPHGGPLQHPVLPAGAGGLLPRQRPAARVGGEGRGGGGCKAALLQLRPGVCGRDAAGALAETLPLSPSNVYGQHKLEAEARVLARCPGAVALRLPWMYDLPGYHLPIRGNLPLNILRAAKTGEVLHFRAMTTGA